MLSLSWMTLASANPPAVSENLRVEIRRTADGIPHILAHDWYGLGYGYGFAQAEDALCTLAEAFITFSGRRAYFFGADSRPRHESTFGRWRNLELDFFFRAFANDELIAEYRRNQPPELNQVIDGFAAGYNRYLYDTRGIASSTPSSPCLRESWVGEITAEDIFRRVIAANLAAGYAKFIPEIVNAVPPGAGGAVPLVSNDASAAPLSERLVTSVGGRAGLGSNLIAFGRQATGAESGVLFGNPHWYWGGPDRFYQAHLTIPGQLNVAGVSFLGYPVIMIGFNEKVAWSNTVSSARRFGLYEISLDSTDPTVYQIDGVSEIMRSVSITVETRGADGEVIPVTRTLYRTRFGPVIDLGVQAKAFGWNTDKALAIRDVNEDNFRTLRTFFYWGQSRSLNEFAAIQRREAGIPWVNTAAIASDDERAWFSDIGAMPNVPDTLRQQCTSALGEVFSGMHPETPFLDGSRSNCNWVDDSKAPQAGAAPAAMQPELFRKDYVANMNDSYWSSNPQQPLEGFPSSMGEERSPLSLRTRLGHHIAQSQLNRREKSPDKLSKRLRTAVLDSRVYSAELFKNPVLAHVCKKNHLILEVDSLTDITFLPARQVDVSKACGILKKWPNTGNASDRGALIWDAFWTRIAQIPENELYRIPFSADSPIETPNALKVDDPRVEQAFSAAIMAISTSGRALNTPRGRYLYARSGARRIPLYGGCGDIGYFTIACDDDNGYQMGSNSVGNSYVQIIHFGREGVEAYTLLAHGLNESVFEQEKAGKKDNGLYRYAKKSWLRFPFREKDILNFPMLNHTVLYP
jgi:acyl-homoserine-lactone acylase